jgi:hypothetical protein
MAVFQTKCVHSYILFLAGIFQVSILLSDSVPSLVLTNSQNVMATTDIISALCNINSLRNHPELSRYICAGK